MDAGLAESAARGRTDSDPSLSPSFGTRCEELAGVLVEGRGLAVQDQLVVDQRPHRRDVDRAGEDGVSRYVRRELADQGMVADRTATEVDIDVEAGVRGRV